ncbi:MAG: hypothetical protein V1911_02720 [Candidatus Micrarchaeota archaeon]
MAEQKLYAYGRDGKRITEEQINEQLARIGSCIKEDPAVQAYMEKHGTHYKQIINLSRQQ